MNEYNDQYTNTNIDNESNHFDEHKLDHDEFKFKEYIGLNGNYYYDLNNYYELREHLFWCNHSKEKTNIIFNVDLSCTEKVHRLCEFYDNNLCMCSKCINDVDIDKEKFISIAGFMPKDNWFSYTYQLHKLCEVIDLKTCHCYKCNHSDNEFLEKYDLFIEL